MTLQWQQANPVHGPGIQTTNGAIYRVHRHYTGKWELFVSGKAHSLHRTRREAKEAAEEYEATHPWDRTGHR